MPDEYGDEAELNYIIEQGQQEAEDFGRYDYVALRSKPAKWLNPPHPVLPAVSDQDTLEFLGFMRGLIE